MKNVLLRNTTTQQLFGLLAFLLITSTSYAQKTDCKAQGRSVHNVANGHKVGKWNPEGPGLVGDNCIRYDPNGQWVVQYWDYSARPADGSGYMANIGKEDTQNSTYDRQVTLGTLGDGVEMYYRWKYNVEPTNWGRVSTTIRTDGPGANTYDIMINTQPFKGGGEVVYTGKVPGLGNVNYLVRAQSEDAIQRRINFSPEYEELEKRIDLSKALHWVTEYLDLDKSHYITRIHLTTEVLGEQEEGKGWKGEWEAYVELDDLTTKQNNDKVPSGTTVVSKVSSDAEETLSNGSVNLSSGDLDLRSTDLVGVRFKLNVPAGAVIQSATLRLVSKDNRSGSNTLTLKAQTTNNASAFNTNSGNLSSRQTTAASVNWSVGNWQTGNSYRSPDLSSLVQRIVNRSAWQSGNHIAFLVSASSNNQRSARSYDYNNSREAAELTVTYITLEVMAPDDLILDIEPEQDSNVLIDGSWGKSTYLPAGQRYQGSAYHVDFEAGEGPKSVRYTPNIPVSGHYNVYGWWVSTGARANNAPYKIRHSNGTANLRINQRQNGGKWVLLGTYDFAQGRSGYVEISNGGVNGVVIADAVRFEWAGNNTNARIGSEGVVSAADLQVYPNPVQDELRLRAQEDFSYQLYDERGALLRTSEQPARSFAVDVTNLPGGFYLLRTVSLQGIQTRKLILD